MRAPNTLLLYTRHLLKQHGRSGLWWAIVMALYIAMLVIVYPTFVDSGTFDLSRFPPFLVEAFDIPDMTVLANFLDQQVFGNLPLILPFFPIMAFANALAGAEDRGTLDILLGNPIPRRNVVLATWISVLAVLIGIVSFVGLSTWLIARTMDLELPLMDMIRGTFNLVPIVTVFGGLALLLSATLRRSGVVIGITFAVLFLQYLMEILSNLAPSFEWVGRLSVFHYYGHAILDGIHWPSVLGLSAIAVVFLIATIAVFNRRDIYT